MAPDGATLDHSRTRQVRATDISRPKPIVLEAHVLRPEDCDLHATQPQHRRRRSAVLKYALAAVVGFGVLYLLSTASVLVLGVLGIAFAGVFAFLVAVCIYAQNNSRI